MWKKQRYSATVCHWRSETARDWLRVLKDNLVSGEDLYFYVYILASKSN